MSQSMKNIAVVLLALTVAYFGYAMYQENKTSSLNIGGSGTFTEEKLAETQLFIERRTILNSITLDTTIFDDPVFRSYQGINATVEESGVGRENPFGRLAPSNNVNRF
jgi:hypothetical protein